MATPEELLKVDESLLSIAQRFQLPQYKDNAQEFLSKLTKPQIANLKYDFRFNARPKQVEPNGDWSIWLTCCGRGYGKTFQGAGWIKEQEAKAAKAGKKIEIGIIGDVYQEVESTMVQALLDMYPEKTRPVYSSNKQLIVWKSGCLAHVVQAEKPKKLRGKNFDVVWIDELAKFQYLGDFWNQLMFCLRKGESKALITTTPAIRANKLIKDIIDGKYGVCSLTRGSSRENMELSSQYRNNTLAVYDGTRLGAQEIEGVLLEDISGGLWKREFFKYQSTFIREEEEKAALKGLTLKADWMDNYLSTHMKQIIVAVDPATTAHAKSNETGIVVCGRNFNDQGFLLEDRSGKYSPNQWAEITVDLFNKYKCKLVVAEKNQGGDLVSANIHNCNPRVPVELVHASKGKMVRAEPVSRLYEQGKIYHLGANTFTFEMLEDQMCNYTGKDAGKVDVEVEEKNRIDSPDRMDATIWAFTYLFSDKIKTPGRGPINFPISSF